MSGERFRNLIWFAIIALVAAILLRDALFTHKGLVPADGILTAPPWKWTGRPSNPLLSDQFLIFLPTLEYYFHSASAASSQSVARWTSKQTFPTVIHFLLPNVLGNKRRV